MPNLFPTFRKDFLLQRKVKILIKLFDLRNEKCRQLEKKSDNFLIWPSYKIVH